MGDRGREWVGGVSGWAGVGARGGGEERVQKEKRENDRTKGRSAGRPCVRGKAIGGAAGPMGRSMVMTHALGTI